MKKNLRIDLDFDWVLTRISDSKHPADVLADKFAKGKITLVEKSCLHLVFSVEEDDIDKIKDKICVYVTQKYGKSDEKRLIFTVDGEDDLGADNTADTQADAQNNNGNDENAGNSAQSEAKTDKKASETSIEETLNAVNALVGAKEFKDLVREIVLVAPEIKKANSQDVFMAQSYLFSLGDGCGLTTYLEVLAKIASSLNLAKVSKDIPVQEIKLDLTDKPKDDLLKASDEIDKYDDDDDFARVICIDISKWIDKSDNEDFRNFLKNVQKNTQRHIFVFRVPFVDKDVLGRIETTLNDLTYVKTVSFPPFDNAQTKEIARRDFARYGMKLTDGAWKCFLQRIAEEKSDGKFYGLNTIKKVVKELVYKKHLASASGAKDATIIDAVDAKKICLDNENDAEGMKQLDKLVGCEKIKAQIEEILAQIALSKTENGPDRPCLHMRFVGAPGTGKTTVARILGKILKEKGVLRIGNLYEYKGRDFCGQYIGETAPKTSGMCRDAYGSVLFIDEAYSLYRGDGNSRDYGVEAIDTLIAEMENHKDDLVVIMAGYTEDMDKLMEANRGLKSRMPYTIEFPNFTREQLFEIYVSMAEGKFKILDDLRATAKEYFLNLSDDVLSSEKFSNARFVRNLFERTWAKAAMRCQLEGKKSVTLCACDFTNAASEKDFAFRPEKKIKLGF